MLEALQRTAQELGRTPTIDTHAMVNGRNRAIGLKLEAANPTGSVKARTAHALVSALYEAGRLRSDSILVESTSGNLGVALADIAARMGIGFTAVVDPAVTAENLARMEALGAYVVQVDERDAQGGYLLNRIAKVTELCESSSRYVWTNQYGSQANPRVHYETTGPELLSSAGGPPDAVFVAVSTGGTVAGVARYVAESGAATRVVAVDVEGSSALRPTVGRRPLPGIGASRASEFLQEAPLDSYQIVSTADAVGQCRAVLASTAICLGGSSGAVLSACLRTMEDDQDIVRAVCLCADSGEKYLSTVYSDRWVAEHELSSTVAASGPTLQLGAAPQAPEVAATPGSGTTGGSRLATPCP